jgi:hypothetical protein
MPINNNLASPPYHSLFDLYRNQKQEKEITHHPQSMLLGEKVTQLQKVVICHFSCIFRLISSIPPSGKTGARVIIAPCSSVVIVKVDGEAGEAELEVGVEENAD